MKDKPWKIKISDEYCEWEYSLKIPRGNSFSIANILTKIVKALKAELIESKLVK